MADQDVVYANLACQLEEQARSIIAAMKNAGLKRLIFIRSTGINNEVPDENHGSILEPYRRAASVIEASDLSTQFFGPHG